MEITFNDSAKTSASPSNRDILSIEYRGYRSIPTGWMDALYGRQPQQNTQVQTTYRNIIK